MTEPESTVVNAVIAGLSKDVDSLTAERDALKADVQHLLDTCVPVAELDDLKAQLAAGDAARAALRDALEALAKDWIKGEAHGTPDWREGRFHTLRACAQELRAVLASSPPERTT